MSFEEFISNMNEDDLKRLTKEFYKQQNQIPTYQYSTIKDNDLEELFTIEKNIQKKDSFDKWFSFLYEFTEEEITFFKKLIEKNSALISDYSEEDLKANFIIPLINKVDFYMVDKKVRGFYEQKLLYETEKFILKGTTDFVVSTGLVKSKKPYFFIQEFKRGEEFSNPRPQLLAELISAIELNKISFMKGAYIIGAIWNFIILEKLGEEEYQYFISENFDSTKLEDLKNIYKNLMFIKDEIRG
jgi:hypothetical protein